MYQLTNCTSRSWWVHPSPSTSNATFGGASSEEQDKDHHQRGWITDSIIDAAQNLLKKEYPVPGLQSVGCGLLPLQQQFVPLGESQHKSKGYHRRAVGWDIPMVEIVTQYPCPVFKIWMNSPGWMAKVIFREARAYPQIYGCSYSIRYIWLQTIRNCVCNCTCSRGEARAVFVWPMEHAGTPPTMLWGWRNKDVSSPLKVTSKKSAVKTTEEVPVYCKWRMPELHGEKLIECTNCEEWYHVDTQILEQ